jgi:predicted histone-like DNA-binding protein
MATKLQAIAQYLPRIIRKETAGIQDVAKLIAGRTSINRGSVKQALDELLAVLAYHLSKGNSVSLPGLGTFSSSVKLNGKFKVNVRVDRELVGELNNEFNGFTGEIVNREMIGKTADELVTIWNTEHPEDPVV